MQRYRVECNFGSRYFEDVNRAVQYFDKCKNRHLDVEMWSVNYAYDHTTKKYVASQLLLNYSGTYLPKY